jgi:hypothetical protein
MALLDNNGQVHLLNAEGQTVEVARIEFSEYYNKDEGTTPAITVLEINNPIQSVTDTFYFLSDDDSERVLFNAINTNEETMPLIELYMSLMSRDAITFEQLLAEVIENYFVKELNYKVSEGSLESM